MNGMGIKRADKTELGGPAWAFRRICKKAVTPSRWHLALAASLLIIAAACQRTSEGPETELEGTKQELANAQEEVAGLTSEIEALQGELGGAGLSDSELELALEETRRQLDETSRELARSRESVQQEIEASVQALQTLTKGLENDRLLLIEIRRPLPDTRKEGVQYWESIRDLAATSNPNLRPAVERVLALVPSYFDWLERLEADEFTSTAEASSAYELWVVPFERASDAFQLDALLIIIQRMDALIEEVQRLEAP